MTRMFSQMFLPYSAQPPFPNTNVVIHISLIQNSPAVREGKKRGKDCRLHCKTFYHSLSRCPEDEKERVKGRERGGNEEDHTAQPLPSQNHKCLFKFPAELRMRLGGIKGLWSHHLYPSSLGFSSLPPKQPCYSFYVIPHPKSTSSTFRWHGKHSTSHNTEL